VLGKRLRRRYWDRVYSNNQFGSLDSKSGAGSSLTATHQIRNQLAVFLKDFQIASFLDIPCGDFNWVQELDLNNIDYVGMDSSAELIRDLMINFPRMKWKNADILCDPLPYSDFILMRDLLVHLNIQEIQKALANVMNSHSRFLAVTNFTEARTNEDFSRFHYGHKVYWRPINLQMEPFNFPTPIMRIYENFTGNGAYQDKCLDIYRVNDLDYRKFRV
jgi:hypothetical protein